MTIRHHAMQVQQKLGQLPGVVAVPRDDALKKQHAESRIWNETWLAAFFHKPCNHELFVRQSLNMEGEHLQCLLWSKPSLRCSR